MAVSKMKKITLLAEKKDLEAVILSLQSYQAVEMIPSNTAFQNKLVHEYFNRPNQENTETGSKEFDELFETKFEKKNINRTTSQLDDVVESIEFLEEILPKPSFFENLNKENQTLSLKELNAHMANIEISSLIKQTQQFKTTVNDLHERKEELEEERQFLKRWAPLTFNPKQLSAFKITKVMVGAIDTERYNELEKQLSHFSEIYIETLHYSKDEILLLVIASVEEAHDVEQTLIRHRFEQINYDYNELPSEELKRNHQDIQELENQIEEIKSHKDLHIELLNDLKFAEEYLYSLRERLRVMEDILVSEHLFVLSGWIEEDVVEKQIHNIEKEIGEGKIFTYIEEVAEDEIDEVPIKFENRKSTSAFESMVSMYSTPKYNELDPTPFVQPFSILFFGMMTADAGYGLLGLIAVFLGLKFLNLSTSMKRNFEFFGQLMIGTTLAGFFFGSFFGFELPFGVMSLSDQLLEIMVLSIGIGFVHLILALFLNTINNNRQGNYAESYMSGYSWIIILFAAIAMAANAFFQGPSIVFTGGIAVILIALIGIVVVSTFSNESKAAGLGQGLFGLFDVTSYIGDVISYTRLTALGVASANIAMAFNLIIGLLPVGFRFTVGVLIFVGLHVFNMFIGMISGYVHTLRLNYVEFFGKFYTGGGKEFTPIPVLKKHITLKQNEA